MSSLFSESGEEDNESQSTLASVTPYSGTHASSPQQTKSSSAATPSKEEKEKEREDNSGSESGQKVDAGFKKGL